MIQHQLDKIEQRGETRGKEIGEKLGAVKSKRESVLRFLQTRFGDMKDEIRDAVHVVEDIDHLDKLIDLAATCESLDDFAGKMLRNFGPLGNGFAEDHGHFPWSPHRPAAPILPRVSDGLNGSYRYFTTWVRSPHSSISDISHFKVVPAKVDGRDRHFKMVPAKVQNPLMTVKIGSGKSAGTIDDSEDWCR